MVGAVRGGVLPVGYFLEGDIAALRIPPPRPVRRTDGLWRHTCFELFAMGEGDPAYVEFNLSPSGEWASYAFRGYREGGEPAAAPAPGIEVSRTGERLVLRAAIAPALLPAGRPLRLGLSAVVEEAGGMLSYWALRHPVSRPDFHHADGFALRLAGHAVESNDAVVGVTP